MIELLKVIGPLTDPTAHGGSTEVAFDLVLPSLPGYGFSDAPRSVGCDPGRTARAWAAALPRQPRRHLPPSVPVAEPHTNFQSMNSVRER